MPAKRRQKLFREISGGRGGAKAFLLEPERLQRAQARLDAMAPRALADMREAIDRVLLEAESKGSLDAIFKAAHDVRGLAGTFGLAGLGAIAGEIRTYGQGRGPDFEPDWPLLVSLARILSRALSRPGELPEAMIAAECHEAVSNAMKREGREAALGDA